MPRYVALLKGINVGGKNIIKMADLKQLLAGMGFADIHTYIQSGNILFDSGKEEENLQIALEKGIQERFGFRVPVIIRTANELKHIVNQCPFTSEEIGKAESHTEVEVFYLVLFGKPLSKEEMTLLSSVESGNETYKISDRNMYMLLNDSIRNSKLAASLQKIKTPSTVRNWKTICTLLTLIERD